jgi:hypothetical protein
VEKALAQLDAVPPKLAALADELERAGPYHDATAETARKTALEYVRARLKQVELTSRCLREGEAWTKQDEKELVKQNESVNEWRRKWQDLLEK